ncbi:hypothetical protein DYE50_11330 [Treponema ruminis]|uniref:Sigma-B regulation protein RsbU (Phosphoserine phosphatase) n=1 Tax=Treponema ruminis TaxID=744515 RepID=A0A7W8G902_9SPIR|nr:SpoIIE family protein phosphatase [Treponema ruminis]MBB5225929.1 sigma-B regulation protein RsbU (phosphoserine phosphatase) [Treponema ruminis]QSI03159.1 hypothetical protein DYE50_11330 [Treponema ruminis]
MQKNKILFLTFSFFILFLSSCVSPKKQIQSQEILNLKDRLYWAECDRNSTIEDVESRRFHKFSTDGIGNIQKVIKPGQEYIWLMMVFPVPENLRHKSLALLITYLHFADKVWVNGSYVGGYGQFPPNERSVLWGTHFYSIPASVLNSVGRNVIFIKVYCKGVSGISDTILLGEHDKIASINTFLSFFQSTIYLFAEGGMLFTTILFLLIFLWRKKERAYLSFSCLCIASMLFTLPFFSPNLPLLSSNQISFLFFIKSTMCEGLYLIVFSLATLTIQFIKGSETKIYRIVRLSILGFCSLITFCAPDYGFLELICPLMLSLSGLQLFLGFLFVVKKKQSKEERKNFRILISVLIPLSVSIIIDFIIKGFFQKIDIPYITLFGWQLSILCFLILLSTRYNRAVSQNEYLNINLRKEIDRQTLELSNKNSELEQQIFRAQTDLEMASLVQKKFFPYPPQKLRGWDISVSYSPLDKVSGDMYDFYVKDNTLNGFSLFDVSGHGIAASLVTMLAKNIIFQSFMRNMQKNETVSRTLYEINDEIIEAKGGIENYLTGLMFRFKPFNEKDVCKVEMANAGHPNPFLYSAEDGICDEIKSGSNVDHHGAIGLDFITVSFPQISFKMAENDILLFYTDGLTESRNTSNEMFGKERVKNIIRSSYAKDSQGIMEDIISAFNDFTKGVKRDDDITIVILKRENSYNFVEELMEI